MDEGKLRKQGIRTTVIVVVISMLLCGVVLFVAMEAVHTAHEADHRQMEFEVREYERNIEKQFDRTFQMLNTIVGLYESTGALEDHEKMEKSLLSLNKDERFISLGVFGLDGKGFFVAPEESRAMDLEEYHAYAQAAARKSMKGENAISKMFYGQYHDGRVFVYSVPIYTNGEIVGVFLAADTLDIFVDITSGNTVMGGEGFIHILDDYGAFLVRSEKSAVKEELDTIFDGPYIKEEEQYAAREAFAKREAFISDFTYENEEYHFYAAPLEVNGWYLFCVNKLWGSASTLGRSALFLTAALFFILVVMLIILYYGYARLRKNMKEMFHLAYFDPVTGVQNTAKFDREFGISAKDRKDYTIAALNLHNFKGINDLFGVPQGNLVLQYLSKVVDSMLKPGEFFCRDTADFFYVYLLDTEEEMVRERLMQMIRTVSTASAASSEYGYDLSVYAGAAVKGTREQALVALQSIKDNLYVEVAFYNQELHQQIRNKAAIESQMYPALQNRDFKMYLQPKFDLKNDAMIGAEALVRWQNADGSFRFLNEFIPLFETNAFCIKLDMYMIERACEQIKGWMDAGIEPVPISVNQSKILFSDRNYPDNLEGVLARYGVPPGYIKLEILEGVEADNLDYLNDQIDRLHRKGFRISMDDFGSGYSSLNMLYQLNIDELKLDRGFLRKASKEDSRRRGIILEQIIHFAKELGIETVAEGIETEEDKEAMRNLDCSFGQGYFYDKPMRAEDFSEKYMK